MAGRVVTDVAALRAAAGRADTTAGGERGRSGGVLAVGCSAAWCVVLRGTTVVLGSA